MGCHTHPPTHPTRPGAGLALVLAILEACPPGEGTFWVVSGLRLLMKCGWENVG